MNLHSRELREDDVARLRGFMPKPDSKTVVQNTAAVFGHYNKKHLYFEPKAYSPCKFRRTMGTSIVV